MFSYQIEFVLGLSIRNKTSKWCFILFWLLNCIKNIYIEINFLTFFWKFHWQHLLNTCASCQFHLSCPNPPWVLELFLSLKHALLFFILKNRKQNKPDHSILPKHININVISTNEFSWSRKETASLQISLSRWQVRKDAQWVTWQTSPESLSWQSRSSPTCCAKAGFLQLAEKRGGTLSSGSPRSSELRRKELPHQFREEHRHTRKQAALSAFPFLTRCIYTQENAAHMQYRPRLERLHFHHRGHREGTCF